MEQKNPFRVELDLAALLTPAELASFAAAAASQGRTIKDHAAQLLFGPRATAARATAAAKDEGRAA